MKELTDEQRRLVKFACLVCKIEDTPEVEKRRPCWWNAVGNVYCPFVLQALKEIGGNENAEDCISIHNKKPPKYAEIFKLAAELAERDIPFQLDYISVGDLQKVDLCYKVGNAHATFLERYMNCALVEQGTGTKGFEDGLLQIDGLLYPEEEEKSEDGTLGWLTAGNVLERILKKEAER